MEGRKLLSSASPLEGPRLTRAVTLVIVSRRKMSSLAFGVAGDKRRGVGLEGHVPAVATDGRIDAEAVSLRTARGDAADLGGVGRAVPHEHIREAVDRRRQ